MPVVSRLRSLGMLLAGFVAGVAFVIACGTGRGGGGGSDAEAQDQGNCEEWETVRPILDGLVTGVEVEGGLVLRAPTGWEPIADGLYRRCVR